MPILNFSDRQPLFAGRFLCRDLTAENAQNQCRSPFRGPTLDRFVCCQAFSIAEKDFDKELAIYSNHTSTSQQKAAANIAIQNILINLAKAVDNSKASLNNAVTDLSIFREEMQRSITSVNAQKEISRRLFDDAIKDIKGQGKLYGCGWDQCNDKAKSTKNFVLGMLDSLRSRTHTAGADINMMDRNISKVLGTLVEFQGNINGVVTSLKNAQLTPPGVVAKIRLKVAQQQWAQLAISASHLL